MSEEAAWALIGATVGILGSGIVNWLLQGRQFEHEKTMFDLQHRSASTVKEIFDEMLNHQKFVERSFKALQSRVGGYTDDELRQFLLELGAQKIDKNGEERWYLRSRKDE
ncbi:hypothetical protein ATO7_06220 [Oceanococcus atlanticus]|uniref:Uncharacterized protein n=1 Tax=Oceanococcus atlanticus TaxID=1317117 RepID=A0A1Y1SIF1_9GAMM|nr:hypothetical protein [Oceanococcus atlanticus]ORE89453.1 hypothetical protein ATO7_06220 [Oceanococcus atlanticus]